MAVARAPLVASLLPVWILRLKEAGSVRPSAYSRISLKSGFKNRGTLQREYRTLETQEDLTSGVEYVVHNCRHCPQWFVHFVRRYTLVELTSGGWRQ